MFSWCFRFWVVHGRSRRRLVSNQKVRISWLPWNHCYACVPVLRLDLENGEHRRFCHFSSLRRFIRSQLNSRNMKSSLLAAYFSLVSGSWIRLAGLKTPSECASVPVCRIINTLFFLNRCAVTTNRGGLERCGAFSGMNVRACVRVCVLF